MFLVVRQRVVLETIKVVAKVGLYLAALAMVFVMSMTLVSVALAVIALWLAIIFSDNAEVFSAKLYFFGQIALAISPFGFLLVMGPLLMVTIDKFYLLKKKNINNWVAGKDKEKH